MLNLKSIAASLIIGVAAMTMTATSALSAAITVPTSLAPGAQYRLAFVTFGTRDATSSDIDVYNTFVNDAAVAAGLGGLGPWTAIASISTVDARDNTSTNATAAGI